MRAQRRCRLRRDGYQFLRRSLCDGLVGIRRSINPATPVQPVFLYGRLIHSDAYHIVAADADEYVTGRSLARRRRTPRQKKKAEGRGDCWTWTALDADSQLILSFRLGDRTLAAAYDFMHDVAERISNRIQLTTDGHKVYIEAVERVRSGR